MGGSEVEQRLAVQEALVCALITHAANRGMIADMVHEAKVRLGFPMSPGEKVIRAGVGNTVRMIPVADVVCFEATEKYVNVVTPEGEALVRMSLRELMARIDPTDFIQVHRSVMVNTNAILSATRDEVGHYSLAVRGLQRPLKVSRAFGHLFRPM